ncbi:MAG: zf-TFIIB domain-containing protein [Bdellovibrionota bacterium]
MKCPACGSQTTEINAGGIKVDACEGGCAGVFFDQLELKKLDEPHEAAGDAIFNLKRSPNVKINSSQRRCPKCPEITMIRHFFSAKRKVEVDQCGQCAGFWLDAGELSAIRSEFKTEAERVQAFESLSNEMFGKELSEIDRKAAKASAQGSSKRAQAVYGMLGSLFPKYFS